MITGPAGTRVAVVDVGTNSTRLLVAAVDPATGAIAELVRRSTVTRLGDGVDRTGRLSAGGIERVRAVLAEYRALIDGIPGVRAAVAVLTSAVRDAANGPAFVAAVRDDFGLDARELPGAEEARLTYLGAVTGRATAGGAVTARAAAAEDDAATLVIDVGGGSTELVVGAGTELRFHVSTQAGVVRQAERHLHDDPPTAAQLAALTADARAIFAAAVPAAVRTSARRAIAVAGTPTSLAAIQLGLDPYDPARVEGLVLERAWCEAELARLAPRTVAELRTVTGLHPARAPAIVPGTILLIEALRLFGLERVEVSEHDLLYGVARATATGPEAESRPARARRLP